MGKHGQLGDRYRDSHIRRSDRYQAMNDGPPDFDARRRLPRELPAIISFVGLGLWSLAWISYASVDPVLGWIAPNAGLVAEGAKDLATASEVGKEAGGILDNLNVDGLLGQVIAFLRTVLKPAIVIIWGIGAAVLVAAPVIVAKVGAVLARRRH